MTKKYSRVSKALAVVALGCLFALGFQNCTGFGSTSGSLSLENSLSFSGNPLITDQALAGTWSSSNCNNDSSGNGSYTMSLEFSTADNFAILTSLFAGVACPGIPTGTLQVDGIYSLGGYDGTVSGATDVTLSINSISLTPANSTAATALNGVTFCSINTWQASVATNIPLGSPCLSTLTLPAQTTLLGISGNSLYMGNSDNSAIDPSSGAQFVGTQTPDLPPTTPN